MQEGEDQENIKEEGEDIVEDSDAEEFPVRLYQAKRSAVLISFSSF